jgi:hypothetical protein
MTSMPLTTKRLILAHVTVCQGCCCGHVEKGKPAVPVDWLKAEWKAAGLLKRIHLTVSGCMGPCDIPNVVTVSDGLTTQWLGGFTCVDEYRWLLDWAIASNCAGQAIGLPQSLLRLAFDPFHQQKVGTSTLSPAIQADYQNGLGARF